MSVRKKLNFGFIIIGFIMFISLSFAAFQMNKSGNDVKVIVDEHVASLHFALEVKQLLSSQGMYTRAYISDPSQKNLENVENITSQLNDSIEQLSMIQSVIDSGVVVSTLVSEIDTANTSITSIIKDVQAKNIGNAITTINSIYVTALNAVSNSMEQVIAYEQALLQDITTKTKKDISRSTVIILIWIAIVAAIISFFIIYIRRGISTPLQTITKDVTILAQGDLTQDIHSYASKDEIGQLSASFIQMKEKLQKMLTSVQDTSTHVTNAAGNLVNNTSAIAHASNNIVDSVQQTVTMAQIMTTAAKESADSMEETSHGILRIAEATHTLHQNTLEMKDAATNGVKTIQSAQQQMDVIQQTTVTIAEQTTKLRSQSEQIGHITKVITDITDQTNLLALNASIEAARAGEHGKGFAVVANEVKKLAEQSKHSATQIIRLTNEIQADTKNVSSAVSSGLQSVKEGVAIIEQAGTAFINISSNVVSVSTQVEDISATSQQISASAQEVSASIHEIAHNVELAEQQVNSISTASQQQATMLENIQDISTGLNDNAQQLQQQLTNFKL